MGIRRRHEAMQSSTFFLVALAAVLAAACASDSDLYAQESELFQNILKEQPEPPIPEKPMTKQVDPAKKHKLRGGKNPAKLVQAKVAAMVHSRSGWGMVWRMLRWRRSGSCVGLSQAGACGTPQRPTTTPKASTPSCAWA